MHHRPLLHPAQVIVLAFLIAVAIGTALLMLPGSSTRPTPPIDAFFTAASAVSITGLTTVDTATHWTVFGQVVILALIQLGGLGVMSAASLLGMIVARRLGLRSQLTAEAERGHVGTSDVRRVLISVLQISLIVELIVAIALASRWATYDGFTLSRAAWFGLFHGISSYNNAGMSLLSGSMTPYAADAFICLPIVIGLVIGGLGFPVLHELRHQHRRPRRWSLSTKIVLAASATLLFGGTIAFAITEWGNQRTFGQLSAPARVLAALFHSANTRSTGFNSVDVGAMSSESWLITDMLMFVGAAPAGTSGGIKVTTLAVIFLIVRGEFRGDHTATAFRRRIPVDTQRQAVTVAATMTAGTVIAMLTLTALTDFSIEQCAFEAVSAIATVGLSTGITPQLPDPAKAFVAALMLTGRLGVLTLGTALALRARTRAYDLPEERPLIS